MKSQIKAQVAYTVLSILLSATARAALIVSPNDPGGTGNNFVSASCTGGTAANTPANHVIGCLNARPTTLVDISSNENLVLPSGGQARVEAADGGFKRATFGFDDANSFFNLIILNINNPSANGLVSFSATLSDATVLTSSPFSINRNGQNFFTISTNAGELIDTLSLSSTVDLTNIRQVRFGDVLAPVHTVVPEPTALSLLGLSMLCLGRMRRR